MKSQYVPEKVNAFEVFKKELSEVVSEKFRELKPLVVEKSEVLLMTEEALNRPRHWFDEMIYKIWVYEPAKEAFDRCYKELKRFYWLDKRLKGTLFSSKMTPEQFKLENPILDTINRYTSVNSRGFAKCLFHTEKTASLKVYEDHWYCYGCNEGGSVIDFLMKIHNITVGEVLNGKIKT